jgi:hypothetical protein
MACLITSGYSLGCRDSQGGVRNVYIANFDDVLSLSYDTDDSIDGITSAGSPATPVFYKIEQDMEVASFTETPQLSIENGTAFYEATLEITLIGTSQAMLNMVKVLNQGSFRLMVQDNTGQYRFLGANSPVRTSAGSGGTGKAFGDLNGFKVTFMSKDGVPAPVVATAIAEAAIVP